MNIGKLRDAPHIAPIEVARAMWLGTSYEFHKEYPFGDNDNNTLQDIPSVPIFITEEGDNAEARKIFRIMGGKPGDWPAAQRIVQYQKQFVRATVPELVVMDFLVQRNIPYMYQQNVLGGRAQRGGLVPDFLVGVGPGWLVWNVNGEYWHSKRFGEKDKSLPTLLLGRNVMGRRIIGLVSLWESDIYNQRPLIWTLAFSGRGLR